MKHYIINKKSFIGFIIIYALILCNIHSLKLEKAEEKSLNEFNLQSEMEKKHKTKRGKTHSTVSSSVNSQAKAKQNLIFIDPINTTDSLMNSTYRAINETFVKEDTNTFKARNRRWTLLMLDKQLENLATLMTHGEKEYQTVESKRSFLKFFFDQFDSCDVDNSNNLNITEFQSCMKSDPYLAQLKVPPNQYAAYTNYTQDGENGFSQILFNVLDSYHNGYINFYEYMLLRLTAFSWRKCSVIAPFIEEVNFECAIEIIANYRTLSRNEVRRLYFMGLQISNNESLRNLDFITFSLLARSVKLYSEINGKEDSDITKSEFNLALDNNLLPMRYNQEIISNMYLLVEDYDKPNQGIDMISFVFYDFFLSLFDVPNPARKYHLNVNDFSSIFGSYLFPNRTFAEILLIPQINLTHDSFQQYTYLNLTTFNSEQDHLLKTNAFLSLEDNVDSSFLETSNNDNFNTIVGNTTNIVFQSNRTFSYLFNIVDGDSDGWLNFYDYGSFIQILYLYGNFDVYNKGRIVAGELYEKFTTYSDLPVISYHIRERAKRFNLIPQDLYVDPMTALLVLKIDDNMVSTIRNSDKSHIYEYELKKVLAGVNIRYMEDSLLNKCLRGVDDNKIPLYDWECAFMNAIIESLRYYESSYAYLTTKAMNLTMSNTVFVNLDPAIK